MGSADGLTLQARAALALGTTALVEAIAEELEQHDLTDEQLRLFLCGGLGMHAVGTALIQPLSRALQLLDAEP